MVPRSAMNAEGETGFGMRACSSLDLFSAYSSLSHGTLPFGSRPLQFQLWWLNCLLLVGFWARNVFLFTPNSLTFKTDEEW